MADSTQRFSRRVEDYLRYRPRYPKPVLDYLKSENGLSASSVIADIGSGTGFFSELFLEAGHRVIGIEPNEEMRRVAEQRLRSFENFKSVSGTAETTSLTGASVDFVTAAQAFHWFDRRRCAQEFRRILRPGGWVVLVWNDRQTDSTPFLSGYERLLREYGTDYAEVDHKKITGAVLRDFFGGDPVLRRFPHHQHLDLTSLKGRLRSASYLPDQGQPRYDQMMRAAEELFRTHQRTGRVMLEYDALVYVGRFEGEIP